MSASRRPILSLTMRIAMSRESVRYCAVLAPVMALLLWTLPLAGQSGAKTDEWRSYGGSVANKRYSSLDQINASNFNKLEVAWRFKTHSLGPRPAFNPQGTPLMAHGGPYPHPR